MTQNKKNFINPQLQIHQKRNLQLNAPLQQKKQTNTRETFTYKAHTQR